MLTADGTTDPLQGVNRLCLAGPEGPRIRVPEVGLDRWIPDLVQREWYKRAMALVAGQSMSGRDGSIEPIAFDTFDALCDEFVTDP